MLRQHIENFLERLGYGPTTEESRNLLEAIRTDGWRSLWKSDKGRTWLIIKLSFKILNPRGSFLLGYTELFPMPRLLSVVPIGVFLGNIYSPIFPKFLIGSTDVFGKESFLIVL